MTPSPTSIPLDHFECYKAKTSRGAPKFTPSPGITIVDHFGSMTVVAKKPTDLCNPANVNGGEPTAPSDTEHGVGYQIKPAAKFTKVLHQHVTNPDFGTLFLDVIKPVRLVLPSAKSLISSPSALVSPHTDHFNCYKVKVSSGTAKFTAVPGVTVGDQFASQTLIVKKPTQLCVPANVNGQEPGADTHAAGLLCYQVKLPKGAPKFTAVNPAFVNNDFGPLTLTALKNEQLCVPAAIIP